MQQYSKNNVPMLLPAYPEMYSKST